MCCRSLEQTAARGTDMSSVQGRPRKEGAREAEQGQMGLAGRGGSTVSATLKSFSGAPPGGGDTTLSWCMWRGRQLCSRDRTKPAQPAPPPPLPWTRGRRAGAVGAHRAGDGQFPATSRHVPMSPLAPRQGCLRSPGNQRAPSLPLGVLGGEARPRSHRGGESTQSSGFKTLSESIRIPQLG